MKLSKSVSKRKPSATTGKKRTSKVVTLTELVERLETRQFLSVSVMTSSAKDIVVLPSVTAAAASSSTISGYTPAQIRAAYGFSSVSDDGTGQTIAIVDAYNDPNVASDLKTFDKTFSLSDPSFSQVSQTGGSTSSLKTDGDWSDEIALDVEWAHAAAPGAKIVLVEATSDSMSNLMSAVNYARSITGVSVVSMSWGTSEFSGQTSYDSYFTTPSGHTPVTFVASSGDDGASGGATWPASSSNVLSVGGTTITTTGSGSSTKITSETGWNESGGGTSRVETAPSYQSSVTGSSTVTTPDVSFDADPNTGFAVYSTVADSSGVTGWSEVGGTSAGAPQWSGLIAIADQARVAAGKTTLDGAGGTLPALYATASNATTYAADFKDITSGNNGSTFSFGGGFAPDYGFGGGYGGGGYGGGYGGWRSRGGTTSASTAATVGYDKVTGLGSPKVASIVSTLLSASNATKTSTSTSATVRTAIRTNRALVQADLILVAGPIEAKPSSADSADHTMLSTEVESAMAATTAARAGSDKSVAGTGSVFASGDAIIGGIGAAASRTVPVEVSTSRTNLQSRLLNNGEVRRSEVATLGSGFDSTFSDRRIFVEGDTTAPLHRVLRRRAEKPAVAALFSSKQMQTSTDRERLLVAGLIVFTAAQLSTRRSADRRKGAAAPVKSTDPR